MSAQKKRFSLPHFLLALLFILICFGGAWYFAITYKPPTTEEYIERANSYLEDWASYVGVEAKTRESIYWDWIDEDGNILPLTGNEFLLGTVDVNGIGQYGNANSDHLEKVTGKFFNPLLEDSQSYFEKNHFIEDKTNSRTNENDPTHTIRRGYQHGNLYCLIRLTPMSDPFGAFFCGTVDSKEQEQQKKMAGLFRAKYDPKHFAAFRITKIDNDFALGSYYEDILGYTWIAKKVDEKWEIIWKGTEIPLCSEVEEKHIPKNIYLKCYK